MIKIIISTFLVLVTFSLSAQTNMSPETLIQLGRVHGKGITKDGKNLIFGTSTYSFDAQSKTSEAYILPLNGGAAAQIEDYSSLLDNKDISPNGKYKIIIKEEKL